MKFEKMSRAIPQRAAGILFLHSHLTQPLHILAGDYELVPAIPGVSSREQRDKMS